MIKFPIYIFLLALTSQLVKSQNSCAQNESYKFYGSNTDYSLVGNLNENLTDWIIPQCKQIGLWHFIREGASYPSVDEILTITWVLNNLQQLIIKESKHNLKEK